MIAPRRDSLTEATRSDSAEIRQARQWAASLLPPRVEDAPVEPRLAAWKAWLIACWSLIVLGAYIWAMLGSAAPSLLTR